MSNCNYNLNLFWSEPDKAYIATCPEFPGVSAFGETPQLALAEMQIALDLAIETYREEGWPLPEPLAPYKHSGQFRIRLPRNLHSKLVKQAEVEGVSLNTLAVAYLSEAVVSNVRPAFTKAQEVRNNTFRKRD